MLIGIASTKAKTTRSDLMTIFFPIGILTDMNLDAP